MDDDKVKQDANNFIKEMATLKKRNYLKEKKYRQELTDEIERRQNECLNERKIQIQSEVLNAYLFSEANYILMTPLHYGRTWANSSQRQCVEGSWLVLADIA